MSGSGVVDIYPLTPLQEGLLFHTLLEPESGVYVVQHHGLLEGPLDLAALSASWDQVVQRRSVLRSSFEWEELDRPLQVVHRSVHLPLMQKDLTSLRAEDREARWEQLLRDDRRQGFDLAQAPLMRFVVVRVGPERHRFLWSHHHILLDGWSLPLLLNEVFSLYEARRKGTRLDLPAARLFRAYVDWIEGQDQEQARAFWRGKLAGYQEPIRLGIDSGVESGEPGHAEETVTLSPAQTKGMEAFCRERELTLNTLVQGAWALVLGRYSGRRDLVFGEVVSGRSAPLPGIESIVGPLINTLPNRVVLKDHMQVGKWLADLQRESAEVRHYEFSPLASIQSQSDLAPGVPLFEYLCAFENFPLDASMAARTGLSLQLRELAGMEQVNYPLALLALPKKEQLSLRAIYATRRFQGWSIRQLLTHVERALEAFVANPQLPLGAIDLLSSGERERLLVKWNDTATAFPAHRCVHELFQEQVKKSPDSVAVVFNGSALTYAELNARANQLAHALRARGVGPESLVALCVERSPEMVMGVLGILKAGGTYVPLDPQDPTDRLAFLLQDTRALVLVTTDLLRRRLPETDGCTVLCLDADPSLLDGQRADDPVSETIPESQAYVMFTSGSTGIPKGVGVPHRAIVRLVRNTSFIELGPDSVALQFAPLSFDASTFEIWGPLLNGGRIAVFPPRLPTVGELGAFMEKEGVSTLWLTAGLFNQQVDHGLESLRHVREVLTGGDVVSPVHARRFLTEAPGCKLINGYGPTENTTFTCCFPMDEAGDVGETVSIGRPIANTTVWILDRDLKPVPVGVAGELYAGGAGLARGYLNRPALTAEQFVPHPFSEEPGARLYRTGDMACWLPNGTIEFQGRRDFQVKLRGFRIELGEIETALLAHDDVQEAVVILRQEKLGHKRLVGYVVPNGGGALPSMEGLRDHLSRRLPAYMVPSAFVALPAFPLTPNGKVDRSAFPAPDGDRPDLAEFVFPRNTTEEVLAEVLRETLGIERVGIHDNFFALGGDSILGIQMVSRLRGEGFECTPLELFQNQTVAKLATVVRRPKGPQAEQGEVTGPVELTPIQHWFLDGEPVEPQHFNQSLLFEVHGDINTGHLAAALEHLVAHHDALRLRFSRKGGRWQQVNAPVTEQSCLTCLDLTEQSEGEQAAAIERICAETQAGFDLSSGLLLRAVFFDLGRDRPGRLFLVVHHLAVDGVSWRILMEDLLMAFRQASAGEAVSLPPKTHSFQEWAGRLCEYAGSEKLAEERDYWCELLESAGDAEPPLDHPDRGNRVAQARQVVRVFEQDLTQTLLRDVPPVYHTQINDLLLAALIDAYHGWSGKERLLVDLEGHGREELFLGIDVSRTVGWFTSIYPVLLEKADTAGPGELLKSVKEQLRGVPQQGIGYGLLRYLGAEEIRKTLSSGPQAQVSFNYLGQLDRGLTERNELFAPADEAKGHDRADEAVRPYAVDISGYVAAGRLQLAWQYSEDLSDGASIEAFADAYVAALERIIEHCLEPEAGGYTPSDFPLARIGAPDLDQFAAQVGAIEDLYPLSPTQEGLLLHTLLEPESGVYVVQQHGLLAGELDMAALSSAWAQTTRRHALLRTSFVWEGLDRPLQLVHPQVQIPLIEEDWTGLSTEEQDLHWKKLLADDRRRGFALGQAPLMRFVVARVGAETYRFLWSQHHLLSDGWSLPLLLKEVFALYEAHRNGTTLELPSHPFRNYIAWLEQQDQQQAESFWRDRLAGFEEPTRLDIDLGGSVPVPVYKEERRELSVERTQQLEEFAREHQLTVNTVVEAAWALLLGRYSRREDVLFGETVSGRSAPLAGIESIVGPLINTLPVRIDLSGTASVRVWLKRLQQQAAEVRHYEHTPLMRIQNWRGVDSGRQLFEYLYVFENYPLETIEQAANQGIEIRDVSVADPTNYPLTLVVAPPGRLLLRITYPEHRFSSRSILQLLAHLEQVLGEFLRDPEIPLAQVSVLTAAQREQLLATRNGTTGKYPSDRCIHELFETQTERTPDATAIVSGDEVLSYQELERRSNQVAHYLRGLGVGPDSLVGICVERSAEMIVGLLGILKAGGAYVPLDPDYPAKRLAFMVQESRAEVLLTQHALLDRLPRQGAPVVCLDTDRPLLAQQATERPDLLTTPEHSAYVIFTSGSTGRPKGVCLPHRVLTNLISWQLERTSLGHGVATLQYAALSFDVSLQEVFTALCSGGELVLLPHGLARDIESVTEWIETRGVQRLFMPFVALARLANATSERRDWALPLKEVITAGEQLQCTPEIRSFFERVGCHLENQYGPSETHVVTAFALSDTPQEWERLPPIGRPIANTQAYVLDEQLRAVPVGVAGELYLGGVGLARGYVHRGDLTAERFVPNPFGNTPGERLYRTGDLVRWQPDWNLEFLGRIDQQVKIRGFRIELGEIEAVLSQHELVRESVVLAREGQADQKRLVAYLVPHAEAPSIESLRGYLKELVPDYMVPQVFVTLENLPLTPSGKVDRKALPAPEGTRPDLASGYVAPRNPTEETLAEVWGDVLGVDRVGVHDSFFALGGDSILGLQVLSRIRAEGFACTPLQLFQNQTIAELAQVVSSAVTVSAEQGEITGPVGLTPIQHWFLDSSPVAPHHFNQSLLLEVRQRIDQELLDAALKQLVAHHDALQMRFSEWEGEWQQFNEPVKEVSCLSRVDLSGLSNEAQVSSIEKCCAETQASMDLDSGLLLRAVYFDLGAERSGRLLLVIHHLVVDGVSWRVLLADLYLAYQCLIRGQGIVLPAKTTSFKEWSRRLEEYSRSEPLALEAPYWLSVQRLAAEVAFPLDSPQGENKVRDSRHVVRELDREQTETLLRKVPPVYRTQINDVLLAALVDAFRKWSGQDRMLLDLEGHGREKLLEAVDVSRTVGWFTILYPVVLHAPEEGGIGELLKSVKEQLRAIPGRGIGYGVLRYLDESEVGKALREGPQAKLSFNYLGQLERGLAEQGDLFAAATESQGSGRSPEGNCQYTVDVTGLVFGERLRMTWRYSENLHTRETMERFADAYQESLQQIIQHCLDPEAGGYTPSDFELAGLDQEQLDSLLTQVGQRKHR